MLDDIKKTTTERMRKSVEALGHELAKIRTGRAHPALLDHVRVNYYGSEVPISQVANVAVEDARTLTVTPWERNMVTVVEKAIIQSDLGINPNTAGTVIRVPMPQLTEERRRDLQRIARHEAEQARVAVRNIRRDANQELKELVKDKKISTDDEHHGQDAVQKLTDQFIKEIDQVLERKETDLMAI
ncbi:ribosome recycling factor [Thiospirillum jenense]|uniref:Ribosome-recycling factor n=1 Tax=Thiospirillum jenense TaxID=1653858 RepID=A0A839HBN8_9GAMM|nr:ribosome recycling factor [Thiospirillum jenense]MBB1126393.1 ribosome recycling factor [Thiospirillum jenense]